MMKAEALGRGPSTLSLQHSDFESPLALLVPWVLLVDDVDAALSADDLVVRGTLLDTGTDLHGSGRLRVVDSE